MAEYVPKPEYAHTCGSYMDAVREYGEKNVWIDIREEASGRERINYDIRIRDAGENGKDVHYDSCHCFSRSMLVPVGVFKTSNGVSLFAD